MLNYSFNYRSGTPENAYMNPLWHCPANVLLTGVPEKFIKIILEGNDKLSFDSLAQFALIFWS